MKEKDYFLALYEVAKVISASLDVTKVLEEIVKSVARAVDAKASSIRLLDSRKKALIMGASYGLSKGYLRKGPVLIKESGLDQKAMTGQLIWIKNAQTDPGFQYGAGAKAEGIKSVIVVPLKVEKNVIGVLRVYTDKVREFNEQETKFLESVANLSALALENARLHQALKTNYELLIAHKYRLDDN
ncbi:MAG TPA: GAF domain-containing protein [Deltaproteobacteria bacterium]|nr:GAF domain-containing protein [Deltaproteobacteria bacterium]HQA72418.1 GAF domain-containing protein [Deltaproteobacteria bacterium]